MSEFDNEAQEITSLKEDLRVARETNTRMNRRLGQLEAPLYQQIAQLSARLAARPREMSSYDLRWYDAYRDMFAQYVKASDGKENLITKVWLLSFYSICATSWLVYLKFIH